MHRFIQCNGYFQSIQWMFNSMHIQFNAYSIQWIFNSMDIQFNGYSIQCIFNSIQCIFNSMHIQFNGYSIQCIFNSMDIHFNAYSIQYSTIHSTFNNTFNSTIHSTFNDSTSGDSFKFPEPAFLLVTDQKERRLVFHFVINMATQFHSDRRLDDFDAATDLSIFLNLVFEKSESICQSRADQTIVEEHVAVLSLLRSLRDSGNVDTDDKETLDNLSSAFSDVLSTMQQCSSMTSMSPTTEEKNALPKVKSGEPGRPAFDISSELLEDLLGLGFSHTKISEMLGVSRWTISRRVRDYGLQDFSEFSKLSDNELDKIVEDFILQHGMTCGQVYIAGYIRSLGLRVQRSRIRKCMARLDPQNNALRWGVVVSRRVYQVPRPNSLWHLDGHHSLIRWKLVIHGCIDGFSRRIMYLKCCSNNLAETVLDLFLDAIRKDGDRWPSRIRVDRGVENVLVCDVMVQFRGEGRASFIAGPSTHNQRIERLARCV